MDTTAWIEQFSQDSLPPELLAKPLPDALAPQVIEHLKSEADRYWGIDPRRSLALADRIVTIGQRREDARQTALGLMARGDALKFLGRIQEAWDVLEQAGDMFQGAGDEVGWARTRIGRLFLALKLNSVAQALVDGDRAEEIFSRHGEDELLVRLNMNLAAVHGMRGDEHKALELFTHAGSIAGKLGSAGEQHLGMIHMNTGVVHEILGNFSQALEYYQRALSIWEARKETRNIALLELNISYIAQHQGRYRHALGLLHGILERHIEQFPMEYLAVKREMAECYLKLNRYADARSLALEVIQGYRQRGALYEAAQTLLHLATAQAELGDYAEAQPALEEAQQIFTSLGANAWLARTRLKRGRLALKQGDAAAALQEAVASAASFEADGQQVNYATAIAMQGQALFAMQDLDGARQVGARALHIAQRDKVPALKYTAHLLLGQIADAQNHTGRAVRHYQAAAATVEKVQRGLTITLRPGFLEDKGEALRALIGIFLRSGQAGKAFETLERTKSQVLLGYLVNRENLRWAVENTQSQALIEELENLRAEHQWFYRLAHEPPKDGARSAVTPEQALAELAARERRMRAITEQLYIQGGSSRQASRATVTSLDEIQRAIHADSLLVEFYNDGTRLWAFLLDGKRMQVRVLPISVEQLNRLLAQLQGNVSAALRIEAHGPQAQLLTQLAQRILQRLYACLIEPLELEQRAHSRLVIVPYGALHYMPFHLLHDGSRYLIEKHEVVILPAAGLATQPGPRRKPGALILAHSLEGRLPYTLVEGQMLQGLTGGRLFTEQAADRTTLRAEPAQILHIAAHGEHRLDQPELSYLQLADGQLYGDDVLQQDLSYELVTLSACETGRANIAASDELIGLGRRFLYAGAGALLVSLWRVADAAPLAFMERMYGNLLAGSSKSAALREAQCSLIAENRQLHPAFWGAFQLIGNTDPLSTPFA